MRTKLVGTIMVTMAALGVGAFGTTLSAGEASAAGPAMRCGKPWTSGKTGYVKCTGLVNGGAGRLVVDCRPASPDVDSFFNLNKGQTKTISRSCAWGSAHSASVRIF